MGVGPPLFMYDLQYRYCADFLRVVFLNKITSLLFSDEHNGLVSVEFADSAGPMSAGPTYPRHPGHEQVL